MLLSVATGAGLQQKIREKMAGFNGHVLITNFDNNNSDVSVSPISKQQDFYPEFPTIAGVKNVQAYANKAGLIRTKTDFEGIIFKGVDTHYDWTFFSSYLVEGEVPNFNQLRVRDVLLSKTITQRLQLSLNDTVQVAFHRQASQLPSFRNYVVKGIYDTGFEEFDKNIMIGDLREVQRLNGWDVNQVGGFEVILDDFDDLEEIGVAIYREIPSTLNSSTIIERYPAIFEWIQLFDNNVWFIIAIMILVAGINMITALLVLILENVSTIGLLKALGSADWSIRKIFLYNASYLIVRGLFWGNGIGLTLIAIQHFTGLITLDPATYYVSEMPVYLHPLHWFLLNVGTLVLCYAMLLIPSYIITKIEPSKSIRFA